MQQKEVLIFMLENKRKIQSNEMKKKIYACAQDLFNKYGYRKVTVDSIVEKAGVSKGSFYVHFESKKSLLSQLIADQISQADLNYESFIENIPVEMCPSDVLIELVKKISNYIAEDIGPEAMTMLYEILITKEENTEAVLGYNRLLYKLFAQVITQGIEQKEFSNNIDIDTIVKHSILSLRGLTYEWCLRYPDFNLEEQTVIYFQILLSGIKKRSI